MWGAVLCCRLRAAAAAAAPGCFCRYRRLLLPLNLTLLRLLLQDDGLRHAGGCNGLVGYCEEAAPASGQPRHADHGAASDGCAGGGGALGESRGVQLARHAWLGCMGWVARSCQECSLLATPTQASQQLIQSLTQANSLPAPPPLRRPHWVWSPCSTTCPSPWAAPTKQTHWCSSQQCWDCCTRCVPHSPRRLHALWARRLLQQRWLPLRRSPTR